MGKFNKSNGKLLNNSTSPLENEENLEERISGIDWKQLLAEFENKNPQEILNNLITKILTTENVEFDQICLVLKHYLLLDNDKSYLNHFINSNEYLDKLADRFNSSGQSPNVQWMISELFKVVTSVCDTQQSTCLLGSEKFRCILCQSLFDQTILIKLKTPNGLNNTEIAILTNLFETISNLCEAYNQLLNFVNLSHVEWMSEAILNSSTTNHKDLVTSIARLFHLFSEISTTKQNNLNNKNLINILLEFYLNRNFLVNAIESLSKINSSDRAGQDQHATNEPALLNLNAKLYLIVSFVNLIVSNEDSATSNLNKSNTLIKLLEQYARLVQYSLDTQLNENKLFVNDEISDANNNNTHQNTTTTTNTSNNSNQDSNDDKKIIIKSIENSVECKILSIDLIKLISNYLIKEEDEYEEEDIEEESISEEEEEGDVITNEMETEEPTIKPNGQDDSQQIDLTQFRNFIHSNRLISSLVKTILNDDENLFQQTDKIEHIYNGINLIHLEAIKLYLFLIEKFFIVKNETQSVRVIDESNLIDLLNYLLTKPKEDLLAVNSKEFLIKLIESIHETFMILFNTSQINDNELKLKIVGLIKEILIKYKLEHFDLCVKLGRIISIMAIKERNTNVLNGLTFIKESANILLELAKASFETTSQDSVESLKLNAEFLDFIIDLFSEDNLVDLEKDLNFIQLMKHFSDNFYSKLKKFSKSKKFKKDDCVIVKTVRDNLKSFVDYKIKNTTTK